MALLDIFKKKKAEKAREEKPQKKEKKPPKIKAKKKPAGQKKEARPEAPPKPKKISEIAYRVLKESQITEKATNLAKNNQYVFKIYPRANKIEVKKAVEDLYGVNVISVKIINIPKKKRRLGSIMGWKKGSKKAIIRIREGQKIEVLPR